MSVVVNRDEIVAMPARARRVSLAGAIASTTLSVLPVFLVGALAVFVRGDLRFSAPQLGLLVSAFYGMSAVASIPGGRWAQHLGPEHAMAIGALGSGATLLGIALFATNWETLFAILMVGGLANAVAQPGANSSVARDQLPERQGTSFGLLQTAIPLSTLLAGFAVPLIGLQMGWRWAFAIAAAATVPVAVYHLRRHGPVRRRRVRAAGRPGRGVRKGSLYLMAAVGGFAAAPANALGAFFVESAVANGLTPSAAGIWLVVGSSFGVSGRMLWGWMTDRWRGDPLNLMALLMLLGAGGFVLLGGSASRPFLLVGTVVAFGAGWAWKGLFNLTVVQQNPTWASAAVGITQTGVFVGSVVGPPAFGLLAQRAGYGASWAAGGAALLIAAALAVAERRMLAAT